jgi:hypothetical protein
MIRDHEKEAPEDWANPLQARQAGIFAASPSQNQFKRDFSALRFLNFSFLFPHFPISAFSISAFAALLRAEQFLCEPAAARDKPTSRHQGLATEGV